MRLALAGLTVLSTAGSVFTAGVSAQTTTLPARASIPRFPAVRQQRGLSCEYAAASAVTRFWGRTVPEAEFMAQIPVHPNPNLGYRGNINGRWGGTDDYGIYAGPLVPVLQAQGYHAEVFYGPPERLQAEIAAGHPVVVWLAWQGNALPRTELYHDGQSFYVIPYEHAVVVTGYDSRYVRLMNVGRGNFISLTWASFMEKWSALDQMSLLVLP